MSQHLPRQPTTGVRRTLGRASKSVVAGQAGQVGQRLERKQCNRRRGQVRTFLRTPLVESDPL
eukprot:1193124-Prorocentrum_minimum.AAC.1